MDYKEKYEQSLERAKKLQETCDSQAVVGWCEYLFPELKESEDEKVRKALLRFHASTIDIDGIQGKEILAWLEKQGEQKPVDKVEPKFKVEEGKWYVCTQTFVLRGKIVIIKGQTYQAEKDNVIKGEDGCLFIDRHDGKASDYFRLWTIQDAKDGDVLVYNNSSTEIILLFEKWIEIGKGAYSYVHIYDEDILFNDWSDCGETAHPATKEQRDLLFQKMKEAGYEWDADKKELKKNEDGEYNGEDYGIDSLYHAQRILEKTLGKVDGYQTDDGILSHQCAITAVKKLYEQKPTGWSEEDERNLQGAIDEIEANKNHAPDYDVATYDRFLSWLKFLKQRYTWKPSDDQMKALADALSLAKNCGEECAFDLRTLYEQLEKLKE